MKNLQNLKSSLVILVFALTAYALTATAATIDVTAYGANGNDSLDDTTAIDNAVAALSDGDTLLFPYCGNNYLYRLNFSRTVSDINHAITENRITIVIQGRIKASGTPANYNEIFYISGAEDLTIIGQGNEAIMQGSGDFNYLPATYNGPMLVKALSAKNLTIKNMTFIDGPANSVFLRGCQKTHITDCFFIGGPPIMSGTNVHAVHFTGEQNLHIEGCLFKPNATGGMAYSWIQSGSTASSFHATFINNQFEASFDHSFYCSGLFKSVIANNICHNSTGTAIKIIGSNNVIVNNHVYNDDPPVVFGGISVRNGTKNIIANNQIVNFSHVAISVSKYGGGWGGIYTDNIIEGNYMIGGPDFYVNGDLHYPYEAIRVWGTDISGTKITNNIIIGANTYATGTGVIWLYSPTAPSYNLTVSGNTFDGSTSHGIVLNNIHDSLFSDNIMNIPTGKLDFNKQGGSSNNIYRDNLVTYH